MGATSTLWDDFRLWAECHGDNRFEARREAAADALKGLAILVRPHLPTLLQGKKPVCRIGINQLEDDFFRLGAIHSPNAMIGLVPDGRLFLGIYDFQQHGYETQPLVVPQYEEEDPILDDSSWDAQSIWDAYRVTAEALAFWIKPDEAREFLASLKTAPPALSPVG